jgi:[ribosomal protein S5]-alanine N-acetyltransferase
MSADNGDNPIETERLLLRRPHTGDATAIFLRYSSDVEVTRYLGWPRHNSVDEALAFIQFSDAYWEQWGCGPLLIERTSDRQLLGGTGLACESPQRASTGYVLAKDAWGCGYATEALRSVVEKAAHLGMHRLHAICHVNHHASAHVLEKCGFTLEKTLDDQAFPNLTPPTAPAFRYVRVF